MVVLKPNICQVIFLSCMFGYMALMMFHKWTSFTAGGFGEGRERELTTERCAPSILITFAASPSLAQTRTCQTPRLTSRQGGINGLSGAGPHPLTLSLRWLSFFVHLSLYLTV